VVRVRLAAVRHVHAHHADAAAGRRDGARLRVREARRTLDARHDVLETHARQDRDAVPGRLAVRRHLVAAVRQLVADDLAERVVAELRLLQADDLGPPLVEPRQEPRHALLDGVDVPGRDAHGVRGYAPGLAG
jgi:hypothetical protein